MRIRLVALAALVLLIAALAGPASAKHSWSSYHWGRKANPITVKYGDNVSAKWDAYLDRAIVDWNKSTVYKMTEVAGAATTNLLCNAASGRVEVCNATYGPTGWLGLAGISLSGGHIVSGYTELNDFYFDLAQYNKPEWRAMVMCQEIAHNAGLGHQDEKFGNANLGSCMDYTDKPLGPPTNQYPNTHDYDQLKTIYGSHLDSVNTSSASAPAPAPLPASTPGTSVISTVDADGDGTVVHVLWVPQV